MIVQVLLLVLSLVILYLGAECALDGAEKIGRRLGLSSLVIGVVIVGFGTSLPELFVSQLACFRGHDELALGNIIGSNLANILLIMGVATVLTPLSLKSFSIKRQMVFHLILTVLLAIVLINFSPWGFLLLALFFAIYMRFTFKELRPPKEERPDHFSWWTVGKLMAGFVLLYLGGELLVFSGSKLGIMLGVSEYVISAIFVAFGTSFPELVTALLACYRRKDVDLITGNVIGSNIFNVAFVLMSLAPYRPQTNSSYWVEVAILMALSFFLLTLSLKNRALNRWSGILFLASYVSVVFYWVR